MKRQYNQRCDLRARPRRFNSDFWEIPVDPVTLQQMADRHLSVDRTQIEERESRRHRVDAIMVPIREMIPAVLTGRQREILELYFFDRKTEREIAAALGISAPSVSQHLFGKTRNGQRIGGAMARLRKEIARRKLAW
jgi:RNA polymerase sigma factor (sigma-70 family)